MYQGRRMRDAEVTKSLCFKKKGLTGESQKRREPRMQGAEGRTFGPPLPLVFVKNRGGLVPHHTHSAPYPYINPNSYRCI